MLLAFGGVDGQDIDGGAALGSPAEEDRAIPFEVGFPSLGPGIKQSGQCARVGIDTGEIRAFVGIARCASQAEVFQGGFAVMFLGADMIQFVRQDRERLRHTAVFTPPRCSMPDLLPEGCHKAKGGRSGLQRQVSLGVKEIEKLAHSEILLEFVRLGIRECPFLVS